MITRLARDEIDDELALERLGDAKQRVDAGRTPAALEPRDRGLRRAAALRELALREILLEAALGHLVGDVREEPAAVAGDDPLVQPLERPLVSCCCASGGLPSPVSIALLLCSGEQPVRQRLDGIADAHASRHDDRSVDAERERLVAPLAAVARERRRACRDR